VELSPDRSVSVIWRFFTRNMDAKARHRFETQMWRPPHGVEARGVWSVENETQLFKAAKAAVEG
jgi:hypothetical protein